MRQNGKGTAIRKSTGDIIFDIFLYIFFVLLSISIIYPFYMLLVQSFDTKMALMGRLQFAPRQFTLDNYIKVFRNKSIITGFGVSIYATICGTAAALLVTSLGAYAISKKELPFRSFILLFMIIPMFIGGGLIPTYLLYRDLGLIDNLLMPVVTGLASTYNVMVIRNFFDGLPYELEESAKLDGASSFLIWWRIYMPLSIPVLVTVGLWIGVGEWNSWFNYMIYMRDPNKYNLQLVLRRIVLIGTNEELGLGSAADDAVQIPTENLKAATILVCTVPILCVYPFLQKYFMKGALVGSVKG